MPLSISNVLTLLCTLHSSRSIPFILSNCHQNGNNSHDITDIVVDNFKHHLGALQVATASAVVDHVNLLLQLPIVYTIVTVFLIIQLSGQSFTVHVNITTPVFHDFNHLLFLYSHVNSMSL